MVAASSIDHIRAVPDIGFSLLHPVAWKSLKTTTGCTGRETASCWTTGMGAIPYHAWEKTYQGPGMQHEEKNEKKPGLWQRF